MNVHVEPLLERCRDLYRIPRGPERFAAYITLATGGGDDLERPPLGLMNPMAREHVLTCIETLLSLGAEDAARRAANDVAPRVGGADEDFRLGLAVLDDVAGGWTHRPLVEAHTVLGSEMSERSGWNGERWRSRRHWITVPLWASDEPDTRSVARATRVAVARAADGFRHPRPVTLADALDQEARIARVGGTTLAPLDPDEADYTHAVLTPLHAARDFPTLFAALMGDDAARNAGYAPLGLSDRAGWRLAAHGGVDLRAHAP